MNRVRVVLVLDYEYGAKILGFARDSHVWVVESRTNTPVVQQFWATEARNVGGVDDPLDLGITSFTKVEGESLESLLTRLLEMVEEHHADALEDGARLEIRVVGLLLNPVLESVCSRAGAVDVVVLEDGFVARL